MRRLRLICRDLLPLPNHAKAYGFELYCRLFESYKDINADVAATENPRVVLERDGLEFTQRELRALGGVPGAAIEARPDAELVHINGRVATDLLSARGLSMRSVFARFLAAQNSPRLNSMSDLKYEGSGVEDFIARSTLMKHISQTNMAKQSLDWEVADVTAEEN